MVYRNVLEAVGHTPLIQLQRIAGDDCARILVKFEAINVGGSIKTRTALQMILAARERGDLHPDSIIVEPTSGNQGIGLALVAAVLGYRAKIIMPDSVSVERRRLVVHYGADVLLEHDDGDIGACVQRCIERAERMAAADPRVYVPQQFENEDNLAAQYEHTAREILDDVDTPIDGFCSGVGTGGTITGIGRALREANPDSGSRPRTQPSSREAPWGRICRWASVTVSCQPSSTRTSTTKSASSRTSRPWRCHVASPVRRG